VEERRGAEQWRRGRPRVWGSGSADGSGAGGPEHSAAAVGRGEAVVAAAERGVEGGGVAHLPVEHVEAGAAVEGSVVMRVLRHLRGRSQVKFTGLTQNSQVDPAV
jgi:hypothetical protein